MRVDDHTIEVAGAPVFYRSASGPGVPALYVHGLPTSSDDWTALLERTGGIAPDLIGCGRTGKAANLDYSIAGLADFVERFLDAIGVRTVRLVAHDWGAVGGLVFAQRHPDRVERIVLCNAVPLLEGFTWHRLARLLRRPGVGELVMGSIPKWMLARTLRGAATSDDAWPDARVDAVWEQFDQGTQRAILRLHRDADEAHLAQAGQDLARVSAPALVVWGERDPWFAPEWADRYGERLPRATVHRVADAGHWPWLDHPGVAELVSGFVENGS